MRRTVKNDQSLKNKSQRTEDSRRPRSLHGLMTSLCIMTLCLALCLTLCLTPSTVLAAGKAVSVTGKVAGSGFNDRSPRERKTDTELDSVIKARNLNEYIRLTQPDLEGASFNVNKSTGRISGTSENKTFRKAFGRPFSQVSGDSREIVDAIENADGYQVAGETKKNIRVTSDYGLKRVLVSGKPDDTYGALSAVYYSGETLLTFDSEESTRAGYEALVSQLGEDRVFLDVPISVEETVEPDAADTGKATAEESMKESKEESMEKPMGAAEESAPEQASGQVSEIPYTEESLETADAAAAEAAAGTDAAEVTPLRSQEAAPKAADEEEALPHGWGTAWMGLDYAMEQFPDADQPITIAVLDSGINPDHEIFKNANISADSKSFVSNEDAFTDEYGHGTKACGVIAESTTPNVSILVLKVMNGKGEASTVSVFQALDYAAQKGADIINLSMGNYYSESSCQIIDSHLAETAAQNVLICASSGNTGKDMNGSNNAAGPEGKLFYPAASPYTVAVGAAGLNDKDEMIRTAISNYGDALDFSAPGANLELAVYDLSTGESKYKVTGGTSFSCPYVCACAAFIKMNDPNNTADTMREQLVQISDDLGDPGWDRSFGYGMPNFINDSRLTPVELEGKPVVTVDTKKFAYDGTPKYPTVTVKYNGRNLTSYHLSYPTDTPDIGTHKVVVTLQGNYTDTFVTTKKYQIIPKSVAVKDLATVTDSGTKARFSWTKSQGTYQIMISTKKNFSSAKKYSTAETSKTISGLKPGQKYYVKVRAVYKADGKNYYSFWSEVRGPYKW